MITLIADVLKSMTLSDLLVPINLILWSMLFLVKLTRIYTKDMICASMYVLWCVIAGQILVVLEPSYFVSMPSVTAMMLFMIFFTLCGAWSWGLANLNDKSLKEKQRASNYNMPSKKIKGEGK